jgi:hypothetical protein
MYSDASGLSTQGRQTMPSISYKGPAGTGLVAGHRVAMTCHLTDLTK